MNYVEKSFNKKALKAVKVNWNTVNTEGTSDSLKSIICDWSIEFQGGLQALKVIHTVEVQNIH